ncbi:MAG: DUF4815 domain-containing protein [Sphingobacteriia bacterium]|nr:DUF4815 domain-containing protein [Sphingobacteriia bacterium]
MPIDPAALPANYHDRHDPADNYDRHLFRAGHVLQSAELNEIQLAAQERVRGVADALFNDGAVLSGAAITVDADTGACRCESGAVYLRGAVRGVPPRTFTVPVSGLVSVGVYLNDSVVTELQDPALRDPAISTRNYQEPGAARLKVDPSWGYAGDGRPGDFYAVYQIEHGLVLSKAPPPQVDAVSQAISRYDRQSAGGFYVSSGLTVKRLADVDGRQVFSMDSGVARVNGNEIIREHARRIEHTAVPDTRAVVLEPHLAAGGTERVDLNQYPIVAISQVTLTREETVTVTHGAFSGAQDLLPRGPVVQIVDVVQGETTYTPTTDYILTADKVNWSPAGTEPAPGSFYSVTYRYIATVDPIDPDESGFDVENAVPGTLIQTSYTWAMPRYDRICLDAFGDPVLVKGVAGLERPRPPRIPAGLLGVATVEQVWGAGTRVINDAVRMIPMSELNAVNTRIDTLFALVAEERLAHNLTTNDPTAKKGVFVDPFFDDDMRDQGLSQTGAVFDEELTLGIEATAHRQTLDAVQTLDARVLVEIDVTVGPDEVAIAQLSRTGCMPINPYDSFSPLPGTALIAPAVDFWTDVQTDWLSPVTNVFNEAVSWSYSGPLVTSTAETDIISERYSELQFLRSIPVAFELSGFGAGELLQEVVFDGQSIDFEAAP